MRHLCSAFAALLVLGCTTTKKANLNPMSSIQVQILCADGDGSATCVKTGSIGDHVPVNTPSCSVLGLPATPLNLGSATTPVSQSQNHYIVQASTMGPDGQPFAFNGQAGVYVMFEGTVSPPRMVQSDASSTQQAPLVWAQFTGGQSCFDVTIPPAFGPTALWVEDVPKTSYDPSVPHSTTNPGKRVVSGSMAIGASLPIYRPQPLIKDIQYTTDPIYTQSPLTNKHVDITSGTNGAPIIVTFVSSDYFTVTDTGALGEDNAWGSIEVYSFSQPLGLQIGSTVTNLDGAVSPFLGLGELGFPIWQVVNASPNPDVPIPPAHEIKPSDITLTLTRMKPWESGLVVAKGWTVCSLQGLPNASLLASYQKYQEWAVEPPPPDGCSPGDTSTACVVDCTAWQQSLNIVTNNTAPAFSPLDPTNVGKKFCNLQGILTHVVPAVGVQLWGITPRNACDLGQAVDPAAPCPDAPPDCNPMPTPDAGTP